MIKRRKEVCWGYGSVLAYMAKACGYKLAAKTPRLAVGMKAAIFYDFVGKNIEKDI